MGPPEGVVPVKRHKKIRPKEVPPPLPDVPGSTHEDILSPPPATANRLDGTQKDSFFPMPGETNSDSWERAFMLESDFTQTVQRPDTSISVAGKPTLWRDIPVPKNIPEVPQTMLDINRRLDKLTRQLENIGTPTPVQSTAELFLFVAIGLILLLAIDTLLRFATSFASNTNHTGGMRRVIRGPGGRFVKFR